jgi:hypothetical protein
MFKHDNEFPHYHIEVQTKAAPTVGDAAIMFNNQLESERPSASSCPSRT